MVCMLRFQPMHEKVSFFLLAQSETPNVHVCVFTSMCHWNQTASNQCDCLVPFCQVLYLGRSGGCLLSLQIGKKCNYTEPSHPLTAHLECLVLCFSVHRNLLSVQEPCQLSSANHTPATSRNHQRAYLQFPSYMMYRICKAHIVLHAFYLFGFVCNGEMIFVFCSISVPFSAS